MKIKEVFLLFPELYLIAATLYYWSLTSSLLNPVAIILLVVLIYQTIFKNQALGLIIASIFIVLNIYMILALISELSEFTIANENFNKLLIFGSLFLGLNLIGGVWMLYKYLIASNEN